MNGRLISIPESVSVYDFLWPNSAATHCAYVYTLMNLNRHHTRDDISLPHPPHVVDAAILNSGNRYYTM